MSEIALKGGKNHFKLKINGKFVRQTLKKNKEVVKKTVVELSRA